MLIKDDEKPHADVIDGQQRLTTLTILISVIASYLTGDNRSNCNKYLREPGNDLEGLAPLPRLYLRQKDQDFFNKYIQNVKLSELVSLDSENLPNESQKHIRANCYLIMKKMDDVFTHTRMIFAKSKAKQNLLDEFREYVLTKVSPKELIDNILEPYADAYTVLVNKKYVATKNAEQINQYLFWLNKIDNSDWMPSAIRFMAEHKNEPDYVLWLMKKLERLASFLHITAKDINRRIERYKKILEEMEINPDHSMNDPLSSIELTNDEKKEFVEALNGEIYKLTGIRRNYVILRLNAFVSDGANNFDFEPNILTIEHVLPQTVSAGSEWEKYLYYYSMV